MSDRLAFLDDPCYTASGVSRSPKVALRRGRTTLLAQKQLPWKPGEEAYKNRRNRTSIGGELTALHLIFCCHDFREILRPGRRGSVTKPRLTQTTRHRIKQQQQFNTRTGYRRQTSLAALMYFSFFLSFYVSFYFLSAKGRRQTKSTPPH